MNAGRLMRREIELYIIIMSLHDALSGLFSTCHLFFCTLGISLLPDGYSR